jgi:hypothetical protein
MSLVPVEAVINIKNAAVNKADDLVPKRDLWKTSPFAQSLRQTQILILEILNVCLWLKFSSSLILDKIERFQRSQGKRKKNLKKCRSGAGKSKEDVINAWPSPWTFIP